MEREIKKENETYTVFQTYYSYGYIVVKKYVSPDEEDITESFEAKEGDEWYGVDNMSFTITADDIEDAGYNIDEVEGMDDNKLMEMLKEVIDEDELYDWVNGGNIEKCDEDYKVSGPNSCGGVERYYNKVVVTTEIKYKFWIENGDVKYSVVW